MVLFLFLNLFGDDLLVSTIRFSNLPLKISMSLFSDSTVVRKSIEKLLEQQKLIETQKKITNKNYPTCIALSGREKNNFVFHQFTTQITFSQ
jgi:hypothetical protein